MTGTKTVVDAAADGVTVFVVDESEAIAAAHVHDEQHGCVRVSFAVNHGHLPTQARRQLVDAVFALPLLHRPRTVQASIPLGDVDLLRGLRDHCDAMTTRAAGSTCLVDGTVQGGQDEGPER